MKKFLAMALAAVMVLALAACGSKNDTADDTGDAQDAQGGETQKLIVGFDAEFPPFGFIAADGTYDGFDLAMAKELCARLGWEYEAVAIDWNSKDAELSSGTINCIWNGFTYTGRENDYTFSDPYVDNSIVMVVKADSGITSLADLAGKSVMAQAASSAVDAINENEDFKASLKEVVELGDYNMGFRTSPRARWTPWPLTSALRSIRSRTTTATMSSLTSPSPPSSTPSASSRATPSCATR